MIIDQIMILYSNIFFVQKLIYSQESFFLTKPIKTGSGEKDKIHLLPTR